MLPLRFVLGAALLANLSACARHHTASTASRAPETSGEISQSETLRAQIVDVDAAHRVITLKDEAGRPFSLDVGENVPMEQLSPTDWVSVKYVQSVAFALKDKGKELEPAVEQSTRRVPDGVQFGRKISATVEIVSVTPDGSHATFRVPDGMVRTVYVDDEPNQKKISRLKPGDEVAVTYTEQLMVAVASGDQEQ